MEKISARLAVLSESQTIAMNQKARELKAQGVDVINLGVGEPDFNTPDRIKAAAIKAIENNFSFYPPVAGYPDLLNAISKKFKNENNLDYAPSQICVCTGAKHCLASAILVLVDKGDEVIIPKPYWVTYSELVKFAEGTNVFIDADVDANYKITPAQLEAAITPKTKALLLCSPSNPSGSVYSYDEMKALMEVVAKHPDIYVISDEIYEHIIFNGKHVSPAQFDFIKDRVVTINGVSKAYAMTGYRIGYVAAAPWIIKQIVKLQGQFTSGACTIAQMAAIEALTGDQTMVEDMRKAFERRRKLVYDMLKEIPGMKCNVPDGAFYLFPDISAYFGKSDGTHTINNSDDFCLYLLNVAHVSTVPGSGFGNNNCFRISYANSDENLVKAMTRIKENLAKLK
jgi:aspartate aminotransferase